MVTKILHQCTANTYRNFFNQSTSQQILKVAFPLIAVALALHVYWRWTATTDIKPLDKFRSTELDYTRDLSAIPCTAVNHGETTSPLVEADHFFDSACDNNDDIRLWDYDNPRKLKKDGFTLLVTQWVIRGGKFFYPEEGKPIVVDCDTVCSPWCHEGKNRSALVYDYLMRAGHHETLLPEGAKNGHLYPDVENVEDVEDGRYPVLKDTTGFQQGKIFRLGDKFKSENIDLQQGFTALFNQLATLNKPVMLFAFVSAVPILMREVMKRTGDVDLNNITIVGFHHDDPMTVPDPVYPNLAKADEDWVKENNLQNKLGEAQKLYKEWKTAADQKSEALKQDGKDETDADIKSLAKLCEELSEKIAPLKKELQFHRRKAAVIRFQNEVLAKLIFVKKTQGLAI
jgi:hypothetical protein